MSTFLMQTCLIILHKNYFLALTVQKVCRFRKIYLHIYGYGGTCAIDPEKMSSFNVLDYEDWGILRLDIYRF